MESACLEEAFADRQLPLTNDLAASHCFTVLFQLEESLLERAVTICPGHTEHPVAGEICLKWLKNAENENKCGEDGRWTHELLGAVQNVLRHSLMRGAVVGNFG